jgi:tetratricopeptide (TPR) repeat protein
MYRGEYEASEHHLLRALNLNPYDAESVEQMGYLVTLRGRPVEALSWMDRAAKLNPIHPDWYNHDRAFALYLLGEYGKAINAISRTPVPQPWMLTWLAACHAQEGNQKAATECIARLSKDYPLFSPQDFADRNGAAFEIPADAAHFARGVALALGAVEAIGSAE